MVKSFEKKNILVVGGAGFIGSHLCDELIKTSRVLCLDNFLTGAEENIDHLLSNPDFSFIRHDITEPIDLSDPTYGLAKSKTPWQGVQEVYFLASPDARGDIDRFPVETMMVNSVGLRNALDLALSSKATFCYVSSDAIYGSLQDTTSRIKETNAGIVRHIDNYSSYAVAQQFGEAIVETYRRNRGLDVRVARVFNTYGPRMTLDATDLVADFTRRASNGEAILLFGGSEAVSSLCYVTDTVKGLLRTIAAGDEQPMNIGSDQPVRVVELAQMVMALVGSEVEVIVRSDYTDGHRAHLVPDITRAKETLSWFPVTLLKDGLKRTVEDLRASRGLVHPAA